METSLKKSSWNSSHNQLNQLHSLTLTELTRNLQQLQQNTFSLQKGLCWSFEVNKQGKQTIFQHFSEVKFLSSTWSTQIFPNVFSPTRGMACVMSHVILVSQSYCRVNDLGGKIPAASLLFVWPAPCVREDLHQRDLPNAVTKKIFKTFQSQVSVDITDNFGVFHRKIIAEWWSLESWEQKGKPIYGLLSLKLKSCRNLKIKQLHTKVNKDLIFPL